MRWLDVALEPLDARRTSGAAAGRARADARDPLVVLKDVCGLDDEQALEVLRWAAIALLRAGVDESAGSA